MSDRRELVLSVVVLLAMLAPLPVAAVTQGSYGYGVALCAWYLIALSMFGVLTVVAALINGVLCAVDLVARTRVRTALAVPPLSDPASKDNE